MTDENKQLVTASVIGVLTALAAAIFVPALGPVSGLKDAYAISKEHIATIEEKEKEIQDKETKLDMREIYYSKFAELDREVAFYESRLPSSTRLDDLLSELNRIALISGQRFEKMATLKPVTKKKEDRITHIELPVEIGMVTDYHGLGNFINMTENSERFVSVDLFEVEADPEVAGQVNVLLTLSTFRFVEESESEGMKKKKPEKGKKAGDE